MKRLMAWLAAFGPGARNEPEWRRERYRLHGVQFVEGPAARAIFVDSTRRELEGAGFELDRGRRFVRRASEEIFHLIELQGFKGQQYGFRWGASLSFLPHAWKRRPEWHRTARGARMDLFHMLHDDFLVRDPYPESRPGEIDGCHGEAVFREDLERAWTTQRQRILNWFEGTTDVQGVAATAEQQTDYFRAAKGYLHGPAPRLVQAFCLARLGQGDEASALLDLEIAEYGEGLEPVSGLRKAFEIVLSAARPAI